MNGSGIKSEDVNGHKAALIEEIANLKAEIAQMKKTH